MRFPFSQSPVDYDVLEGGASDVPVQLSSEVGVTVRVRIFLNKQTMMSLAARMGILSPYLQACGPLKTLVTLPGAVNKEVLMKCAASGR